MIQKIKKPVSILLAVMMVVSLFAAVPFTASARGGEFSLTIKTEDTTFSLDVIPSNTIDDVKMMIQDKIGIALAKQTLYYGGTELSDNNKILSDYVVDFSNVTLTLANVTGQIYNSGTIKSAELAYADIITLGVTSISNSGYTLVLEGGRYGKSSNASSSGSSGSGGNIYSGGTIDLGGGSIGNCGVGSDSTSTDGNNGNINSGGGIYTGGSIDMNGEGVIGNCDVGSDSAIEQSNKEITDNTVICENSGGFVLGGYVPYDQNGNKTNSFKITSVSGKKITLAGTTDPKFPVSYIDENGDEQTVSEYTSLSADNKELTTGWYVLDSSFTYNFNYQCTGDVNLILCDGCKLSGGNDHYGFRVTEGNSLTFYGQEAGTGEINTFCLAGSGIGGGGENSTTDPASAAGLITINGGTINANVKTYVYSQGAAIGGGCTKDGTVVINGGTVNATGRTSAAAIGGGGYDFYVADKETGKGYVTINGGNVEALKNAIGGNANGSIVTLSWKNPTDSIKAQKYTGTVTLVKPFKDEDGTVYPAGVVEDNGTIAGKTLTPYGATVTWKNGDTVIKEEYLPIGEPSVYSGETPTKAEDENYTYAFAGWKNGDTTYAPNELPAVTGDVTYTATFDAVEKHIHDGITFEKWESTTSLPPAEGNYYLTGDVTLSGTWTAPAGNTKLCLNGKTITRTGTGGVIKVNSGATLAVYDCGTTGKITGGNSGGGYQYGAGVSISDGHFILNGGSITGNTLTSIISGGGVAVEGQNGIFDMNGGSISNNSAAYGGGVYCRNNGVFNLNGGTISGNTARSTDGGGVHVYAGNNKATMNMTGGVISGNTAKSGGGIGINGNAKLNISGGSIINNNATSYGGGISNQRGSGDGNTRAAYIDISGNPVIKDNTVGGTTVSNVYLVRYNNHDYSLLCTKPLTEGAEIGISLGTANSPCVSGFAAANPGASITDFFTSDNPNLVFAPGNGDSVKLATVHTVTWKNGNNVIETDTGVLYGSAPSYDGAAPTKEADTFNTYEFAGWKNGETTYAPNELPAVTGDVIYTAQFTAVPKLFAGHSVSLDGDIGVNFFINPNAADFANATTATVKFTWDGNTKEVNLKTAPKERDCYKATCEVVAAQMTHKITAEVYIDGEKLKKTDSISVQDYSEKLYNDPEKYDDRNKPEQLKAMAKALLNYGSEAQTVLFAALTEIPEKRADVNVGQTDYSNVTADAIQTAVNTANPGKSASNLKSVASEFDAKLYAYSLIYLSQSTLRLYFVPAEGTTMAHSDEYDGSQSNYYYYVQKTGICASELDTLQEFEINNTKFRYSALDYAKAVISSSKMTAAQKNLAKSLFLYNQAANAYFDDAPAPVENIVDLSTLEGDYEAQNNDVLTGTLSGNKKITIADGATVTLKDADITCLSSNTQYDGIALLGDATILLEGENTVKGGYKYNAGIFVPENKTLTIDGTGSLNVSSGGSVAAIGAKRSSMVNGTPGGNIVINGGTINATGGNGGAGIGGCPIANCGTITINGGTVTAVGNDNAPGIGSGNSASFCASITINGGTVTATGNKYAAGIGSGQKGGCGDITIAGTVTQVTATKGELALNSIGAGYSGTCGTVTIEDGANVTQN